MSTNLETRCRALINELGLASAEEMVGIEPLTGGVSSDIALVDLGQRKVVVKFALEKLRVAEQWFANVDRSLAEYRWLQFASSIVPEAVPVLLGCSEKAKGFAMEFVAGDKVYLWKRALLAGEPDRNEAATVGDVLGRIHRASAAAQVLAGFQNQDDFHALRLEPYLRFTASRHLDLAPVFNGLIEMLIDHELVLVHGDVSPKNIIFRNGSPIFLDAECATAGDPSFDISFCLNHLLLKAIHLGPSRQTLLASVGRFWEAYRDQVTWESSSELENRVCRLLPAMMLARVDGKSPVEYLDVGEQQMVRSIAVPLIRKPDLSLAGLVDTISEQLKN